MTRHILSLVITAALLFSCSNSGKRDTDSKNENELEGEKVEFASLIENPDNYIEKNIIVEGKVVHVCTMSGKKLFIVGEDPDVRLFISAGEDMPKFPMELLGCQVVVEGKISKVGGPALGSGAENEGMGMGKSMDMMISSGEGMPADSCETETALAAQLALADVVMEYKSHIVK